MKVSSKAIKENGPEKAANCAPLLSVLRNQILPWTQDSAARVIIGTPKFNDFHTINTTLPAGVTISRRKFLGKRVALRGKKRLDMYGPISAMWPEDKLCVKTEPVLACIVGGIADFCMGEYTAHCPTGTFIILPPGVPHPTGFSHLDKDKDASHFCNILWLSFWDKLLRCWVCHSKGSEHISPSSSESIFAGQDGLTDHFRALVREAEENLSHHDKVCGYLMGTVFTVLLRLLEEGRFVQPHGLESLQPERLTRYSANTDIRDYIRSHLSKPLTLAMVGRALGMSRTRLAAEFSSRNGPTFTEYLTSCRLKEAEELLRTSDWPVSLIGTMVGLSPSRLREIFHEVNGCSPTEFRHQARGELLDNTPVNSDDRGDGGTLSTLRKRKNRV